MNSKQETMDKNNNASNITVSYNSSKYFSPGLLPPVIKLGCKNLSYANTLKRHNNIELLYILNGSGTIQVNGISYPVTHGNCVLLNPHHFHRLIPEKGRELKIIECHVNIGTFLYLSVSPYYTLDPIAILSDLYVILLESDAILRTESVWNRLLTSSTSTDVFSERLCLFLLLKIFALFSRYPNLSDSKSD